MTVALTLWLGADLARAVEASRGTLERVRPDVVQLHAAPSVLARAAPALAAQVRAWVPGVRLWLGVAGDAGQTLVPAGKLSLAELHRRRVAVGRIAEDCGADTVVLNCEGAWKRRVAGFTPDDAARWVAELRAAYPRLALGHSAYDCPTLHSSYPWSSWRTCDAFLPQVYWAPKEGSAPRGTGAVRLELHRTHWTRAVARDWLPPGPITPYLQMHGCDTADLCAVADAHGAASFWASPTRCDLAGIRAAHALAEIARRGYLGPGRVRAFQRAAGLVDDGVVGPKTLAALGVA